MAVDTAQKRMSAISPSCPWRGPMVDATESGFDKGNRQAADFMYSGIEAAVPGGVASFPLVNAGLIGSNYLVNGGLVS